MREGVTTEIQAVHRAARALEALLVQANPALKLATDAEGLLLWAAADANGLIAVGKGGAPRPIDAVVAAVRRFAAGGSPEPTTTFHATPTTDAPVRLSVLRVPTSRGEAVYGVSVADNPSALVALAARCGLSPAETTVLDALARGLSNRELASTLCISAHTVKTHVHRILGKLGVRSRVQAALLARGADRVPAGPP